MLNLKTPIVFMTLTELEEATTLGLAHKKYYLSGEYSTPMLQSTSHKIHTPLQGSARNMETVMNHMYGAKLWADVREEYIPWEPKAGEMVGCGDSDSVREFISMTSENKYLCWNESKSRGSVWNTARCLK